MADTILVRLLEHNNWANGQIIQACAGLSDEQLDAEPHSATVGSIRTALWHLVEAQDDYLATLTGEDGHYADLPLPPVGEIEAIARASGEGFVALVKGETGHLLEAMIHKEDGYSMEPWVVIAQAINHATEHRGQIKSMLSALGVKPPRVDGWGYGWVTGALMGPHT